MRVRGLVTICGAGLPRHAGALRKFQDARSVAGASSTSGFCPRHDWLANCGFVDHNM